jgi:hypothetical protein
MARMTSAQRYNAKAERIFARSKVLKTKHAPLHAIQLLQQMTDKVDAVSGTFDRGENITHEDWSELHALTRRAREVLEYAQDYVKKAQEAPTKGEK